MTDVFKFSYPIFHNTAWKSIVPLYDKHKYRWITSL